MLLAKKQRSAALSASLYRHVEQGSLSFIRFEKDVPVKTKDVASMLEHEKGILLVLDASHKGAQRAFANLEEVRVRDAARLSVRDIMGCKQVWIDETALVVLEKRCNK